MTTITFKRLPHGGGLPLPAYATEGAAGMDICAAEENVLAPGGRVLIRTGFAVAIPPGYEIQVRPRSGLAARRGLTVPNTPGTIDSDYRGEIKVVLFNASRDIQRFVRGDRIAQLVVAPVVQASVKEVETLPETVRGEGGFGSTGL